MPKIIAEVREAVLRETKRQLFESGAETLTMRSVAAECNIAVGTLYNYFPSKDVMVAFVMLEDWMVKVQNMGRGTEQAESLKEGLQAVYLEIESFSTTYRRVWNTFQAQPQTANSMQERHRMLMEQIGSIVGPLAERFGGVTEKSFLEAAVQLILQRASGGQEGQFEELYPVLEKLLSK